MSRGLRLQVLTLKTRKKPGNTGPWGHRVWGGGDKGECERSEHEKLEEFRGGRAPLKGLRPSRAPFLSEHRTPRQPLPSGDKRCSGRNGAGAPKVRYPLESRVRDCTMFRRESTLQKLSPSTVGTAFEKISNFGPRSKRVGSIFRGCSLQLSSHSSNSGTSVNAPTSKTPRSVTRTSGMTVSARNERYMKGFAIAPSRRACSSRAASRRTTSS